MSKLFSDATYFLSRREHGAEELVQKLASKGYEDADIQVVLLECQRLGLQSDERFTESRCRARIRQGYGPIRIRQELQNLHIDRELIAVVIEAEQDHWLDYAREVWLKKYKSSDVDSYAMIQKQKNFLLYRGFPMEVISKLFIPIPPEDLGFFAT